MPSISSKFGQKITQNLETMLTEAALKTWKTSRNIYLDLINKYSLDQLNTIPQGFNNNLIWNVGHVIVAQQSLVYKGSSLPIYISEDLVNLYKPGTKPTGTTTEAEVNELKDLLISLIDKTESDLQMNIFSTYNERTTGTGFHLASIQDAITFNNYHEGLHLGYMMSLRKFV